ncbi:MAG: cation diffusion facilitator family transporter [Acidithiobacillus sp.]|jgi:cation diffusion facilitator family transporter
MSKILAWLGFGGQKRVNGHGGNDHDDSGGSHGHTHGVIDATIATTTRGIWAIKWSFIILAITSALQITVVIATGSVALLADTIHNVGDATTAIPLWFAFMLARRKPSKTFTYGYGRVEDLAGISIVLIILFSAGIAGYEAINRLIHPQPITQLLWVGIAGVIGFIGNEVVAVFRIRVGREIESAALIADGYHARTDGLTSLAVVLGAVGVWAGFPLADPIIGLLITIAILGIVWQSSKAVLTRMLDGVEPEVIEEIRHAAEHVPGVKRIIDTRARWIGHRLHTDLAIDVGDNLSLAQAKSIAALLHQELLGHLPALRTASITFGAPDAVADSPTSSHLGGHHHAPEPFKVVCSLAEGSLEIVDTPQGERMRLTLSRRAEGLQVTVSIKRPGSLQETLLLSLMPGDAIYQSTAAPEEPHEFEAELQLLAGGQRETLCFQMKEPDHAR